MSASETTSNRRVSLGSWSCSQSCRSTAYISQHYGTCHQQDVVSHSHSHPMKFGKDTQDASSTLVDTTLTSSDSGSEHNLRRSIQGSNVRGRSRPRETAAFVFMSIGSLLALFPLLRSLPGKKATSRVPFNYQGNEGASTGTRSIRRRAPAEIGRVRETVIFQTALLNNKGNSELELGNSEVQPLPPKDWWYARESAILTEEATQETIRTPSNEVGGHMRHSMKPRRHSPLEPEVLRAFGGDNGDDETIGVTDGANDAGTAAVELENVQQEFVARPIVDTLANGEPLCFMAGGRSGRSKGKMASRGSEGEQSGMDTVRRCLPTAFFIGVSKSGTTSLSNWMAEHPQLRFVPPPGGHDNREGHVFDYDAQLWAWISSKPGELRRFLGTDAVPGDVVMDFTPHYSLMAEAPHRIADLYGDGPMRNRLKFLVLLREPVARTVSSWIYKSNPASALPSLDEHGKMASSSRRKALESLESAQQNSAKLNDYGFLAWPGAHDPGANTDTFPFKSAKVDAKRAAKMEFNTERRPLSKAVEEGQGMVANVSACFADAMASNLFGNEPVVTSCRKTKGRRQCEGHPPCKICDTHTEPWCNPRDFLEPNLFNAHVGKSMYAMQLSRWFRVFGRENFKVMFTEHLEVDPVRMVEEALSFIGLDMVDPDGRKGLQNREAWRDIVGVKYNKGDQSKKELLSRQVTPKLLQEMHEFFEPHNKELEALLGIKLPASWYA